VLAFVVRLTYVIALKSLEPTVVLMGFHSG